MSPTLAGCIAVGLAALIIAAVLSILGKKNGG
jgi:hypothetical protein